MKILVTGATGGLGSQIVQGLLNNGIEVIATSRDSEKAKNWEFYSKVTYIPYDIDSRSDKNLFSFFNSPDKIIHCAWEKLGAAEYKNPLHTSEILDKHKYFLSNLISNGIKDITVIGTCYEYGLREGVLKETDEPQPTVPYAIAKNRLREFIEQKVVDSDIKFKWIRVFYVFGEVKGRKNLYTQLMEAIQRGDKTFNMSGGEQIRDFLSSEQIAHNICRVSMQDEVTGVVNCCSGRPVRLRDYINDFLNSKGYNIDFNFGYYPYPDYEPMWTWGSVDKLNSAIKYK